MSDRGQIARATGLMGAATVLSRVAGLARDMVVAAVFGAGFGTDAFFVAFTIPNLLRRFFGEGALTAAFVPTFSQVFHRQGKAEARRVLAACWTLLALVLVLVVVAGILGSPLVVRAVGFGFAAVEGKLALTDTLNRLMFPYIFFVSLLALATGALNVAGHYFLPAVSPVLLNLSMIASAVLLAPRLEVPVTALAIGVLAGGALQLLLPLPLLARRNLLPAPSLDFGHPAVGRIARLMMPGLAGVAIYQINVVVTRLLASFLPEGSVSYLYYGQRLFEFPQGIFIVALGQAVLPAMSRQAALDDQQGLRESLRFAMSLMLVVIVPAAVGLILCAVPVYGLFFMGGAFTPEDVLQTARALAAYAPGLLFVGISRLAAPTFYALQDTRTPVWISFWTLLVNLGCGLLLMGPLGHVGLALALTLAAGFNCGALLWALRRRLGSLGIGSAAITLLRMMPVTAAMAAVVWLILGGADWLQPGDRWYKGGVLGVAMITGIAVYGGGCLLLRIPEAREAAALFKRKLLRRNG